MSRSFFIGLIAALAVLVSAGPALGATVGKAGSCGTNCIAGGRAFDNCTGPFGLFGATGGRTARGMVIMPDPGFKLVTIGRSAFHGGDTATHEGWQVHQACTIA